MEIGLDPDRFWLLTPAQAGAEVQAALVMQRRRHDEAAWLAWNTAVLTRMEKMPSWQEFSGAKPPARRWQDISAELAAWADAVNNNNPQGK